MPISAQLPLFATHVFGTLSKATFPTGGIETLYDPPESVPAVVESVSFPVWVSDGVAEESAMWVVSVDTGVVVPDPPPPWVLVPFLPSPPLEQPANSVPTVAVPARNRRRRMF